MDQESAQKLARLVRNQRVAALGTLHDGVPYVSMVLYLVEENFSAFHLHVSRLSNHTQDMLKDARVSLMIAETDTGVQNPQTLARVSIQARAVAVPQTDSRYEQLKARYLARFPQSAISFTLPDFAFFRIEPRAVRFVAGFARAFDVTPEELKQIA